MRLDFDPALPPHPSHFAQFVDNAVGVPDAQATLVMAYSSACAQFAHGMGEWELADLAKASAEAVLRIGSDGTLMAASGGEKGRGAARTVMTSGADTLMLTSL
jgi:hypothetical protein